MGFLEGLRHGRDAALAGRGRSSAKPGPRGNGSDPGAPSPIKFGYYCDDCTGAIGPPNYFYGERHCLVLGLNGAGKSTRFLIELLMTARNRSLFVFDIKGELAYQTADERKRYGAVKIINPYRVLGMPSDGFNPLAPLEPGPLLYDAAAAIAEALIEIEPGSGQYWSESAQGLLVALIMFEVLVARRESRPASLLRVRQMLTEADEYATDAAGRKRLVKGLALTAARMVACGNPKIASLAARFTRTEGLNELAGIKSTADTQTQWMLADAMVDLEKNGVDFRDLRHRATTIYVVLPPEEISNKRRWTSRGARGGAHGAFQAGQGQHPLRAR